VRRARRHELEPHRPTRFLGLVTILVVAGIISGYDFEGHRRMREDPVIGVDYLPIVTFVAERRAPGEKVIVALPPPAYLAFGTSDDLIFLPGPLDRNRAQRYTRLAADGRLIDFWTGVDSIVSTAGLCQSLLNEPGIWVLVDQPRLIGDWALLGSMSTVIEGLTYVRHHVEGGAQARRVKPLPSRDPVAEQICYSALTGQIVEPGITEVPETTTTPEP
jgi:hypothetical protein